MSNTVHIKVSNEDAEAMLHMDPARILTTCENALRGSADHATLRDLQRVRNAWVLLIGTARLQLFDHNKRNAAEQSAVLVEKRRLRGRTSDVL